jgi:ubiquinol-cytochrome c reductase iron-sulfur subunit
MSAYSTATEHVDGHPTRRDFLFIATGAAVVVAAGAVVWPLIDQMEPDAATIAAGAPLDVDLKALTPGQQMIVKWRGHPIFVTRRTPDELKTMQNPALLSILSDPNSQVPQQPAYAANFHRSSNPEYGVLVGVCTHLGCIPNYEPNKGQVSSDWLGGYFCPCHGSKYDLAGRVFRGVPAPYNLPVPPYRFTDAATLRIGENPDPSSNYDLSSIVQL